jgi:CubicO group peptidase (beta-lactamase class C family)
MARAGLDVGELLLKLMTRETGEISKVDYAPQKPEFQKNSVMGEQFLVRKSPESQGVSSAFFTELIRILNENRKCNMHKFMAVRHGYVIAECAFEPYDMDMWHVSYSMCKSIVGMAIGLLVEEGKITTDTNINNIFSTRKGPLGFLKKNVTVENLLNMSSGVEFGEAGAISGNDWRKEFLNSGFKFEPGTQFEYNSMNTYMLSAIVTEITGKSLFEFCKERIFDPMGIKRVYWESCPQSITKGGWGLFMRAEDMAKLGVLYLQKGKWNGEQIIPESWVYRSTSWQIETGKDDNEHYGYQLWINDDRPGSYAFNGMLGQNVFVYPDIDMVVVTNAGNSDIFQTSLMAVTIRNHMKDVIEVFDEPLPENFAALSELKAICKSVSGRTADFPVIANGGFKRKSIAMTTGRPSKRNVSVSNKRASFKSSLHYFNNVNENSLINEWFTKVDGKTYDLDVTGIGIFPLMMQIVHNNFTDGIRKIGFRKGKNNSFFIEIYEGEAIFSLRCGFGGKRYTSLINMHGEKYLVSLSSSCKTDEYNRLVLRNDIYFLEEACSRTLNIYFEDDAVDRIDRKGTFIHPSVPNEIELRFFETPGTNMLIDTMRNLAPDGLGGVQGMVYNRFVKGGMKGVLEEAVKSTLQPVVRGHLTPFI